MSEVGKEKLRVKGKIYINESLCPEYRRLFGICNSLYRKKKLVSSYTMAGIIVYYKWYHQDLLTERRYKKEHINDIMEIFGVNAVNDMVAEHKKTSKIIS